MHWGVLHIQQGCQSIAARLGTAEENTPPPCPSRVLKVPLCVRDPLLLWGKDEYGVLVLLHSFADPHILHAHQELLRYVSRDHSELEMIGCEYKSALRVGRPKNREIPVPYGSWEALPVSREDPQQTIEREKVPIWVTSMAVACFAMVVLRKPSCALHGVSLSTMIPSMLRDVF